MHALLLSLVVAAPVDDPTFDAVTPEDDRPVGPVVRLTRDFTATIATRNGEVTVSNVVSLRRSDRPLPAFPTGPHLVTTAGDRIAGRLVGGDGQSLRFLPSVVPIKRDQAWKVPLSSVVVVWLKDTPAETPLDSKRYEWLAGSTNQDVLRFLNGDIARGTLDGLDAESATPAFPFLPEQGAKRTVAAKELAAVAFNPALARFRKPKAAFASVVLTDGSRLALANASIADELLTGDTLFGQRVVLPISAILAFDVMKGRAAYLSDLKPKKVEQAGFFGAAWPWTADRTVHGDTLRVKTAFGETTGNTGLGTHPRTTLTYDLAGKYRRFESLVGLDPANAVRAKVTVRVLVDGKEQEIPELQKVSLGKAVEVRVDVPKAKELTLVVDFGSAGGVGADVNWVDARLVE